MSLLIPGVSTDSSPAGRALPGPSPDKFTLRSLDISAGPQIVSEILDGSRLRNPLRAVEEPLGRMKRERTTQLSRVATACERVPQPGLAASPLRCKTADVSLLPGCLYRVRIVMLPGEGNGLFRW